MSWVIDQIKSEQIKLMFDLFGNQGCTLRQVSRELAKDRSIINCLISRVAYASSLRFFPRKLEVYEGEIRIVFEVPSVPFFLSLFFYYRTSGRSEVLHGTKNLVARHNRCEVVGYGRRGEHSGTVRGRPWVQVDTFCRPWRVGSRQVRLARRTASFGQHSR